MGMHSGSIQTVEAACLSGTCLEVYFRLCMMQIAGMNVVCLTYGYLVTSYEFRTACISGSTISCWTFNCAEVHTADSARYLILIHIRLLRFYLNDDVIICKVFIIITKLLN